MKRPDISDTAECIAKAAELNNQQCFEFMTMNGVEINGQALAGSIKGGNMAIIKVL